MKLGLFGGSFDPVHYGHLILAQTALEHFKLDRIIFIPAQKPPHKIDIALAPGIHRLKMLKLATEDNPFFKTNDYELRTKQINYTYKTIEHFLKLYPKDRIYFILGPDLLSQLHSWGNSKKLLDLCPFLVGNDKLKPTGKARKGINLFKIPEVEISSTLLRNRLKKKLPIKYLTPQKVENYIRKHRLYA